MKQTREIIIMLSLMFLLCGTAAAEHTGPYIGASIGANALVKAKCTDDQGDFRLAFDPDMQWSAQLGWDYGQGNPIGVGRIELEYSFRNSPLDKVSFVEGGYAGAGKITTESLLINCIGIARDAGIWAPYLGGGAGAARIKASGLSSAGNPLGSGSTVVFAYQGEAGVDVRLTDWLSLDVGYRLFGALRPHIDEANGGSFEMEYLSHSAVVGLRAGF
ncbi:MAG: outer membrane beta-barrel protein [Desulfuromonadaceae bacterium]|nr:outer membrane beta-barrel protein [Desulfuromonadaceae bacterium]MDD5104745.1 outer membrane beta-barrel protein [Desulfuromonadaceae bacterium]